MLEANPYALSSPAVRLEMPPGHTDLPPVIVPGITSQFKPL